MRTGQGIAGLVALLTMGLMAGCGGGGLNPPPATGESAVVQGSITGFGSVIVNGVRFDVSGATLSHDGTPITEDDLRVGMNVRVRGDVADDSASGTAVSLEFDDDLKGPVSAVDVAGNRFEVLGRTVLVDAATGFENLTLETLALGQVVEVSGFFDAEGRLRASYVELESDDDDYELKGLVSNLDPATFTFFIGNQQISYFDADFEGFPLTGLANGQWVEVELEAGTPGSVLRATEIELEGRRLQASAGQRVEMEGYITRFVSAGDFDLNGQPVTTTDTTVYEDGAQPGLLALNSRIELVGAVDTAGVVVASRIELEDDSNAEIEGPVTAVDAAVGTLGVMGVAVRTTASTQYRDDADRLFGLGSIASGDQLEIDGFVDSSGTFVATRIERDDDDEVSLRGPVSAVDAVGATVTVFGVPITTTAATEFEGREDDDLTQAAFFAQLLAGDLVEVEGVWTGSSIVATEIEIEDDDIDDDPFDD